MKSGGHEDMELMCVLENSVRCARSIWPATDGNTTRAARLPSQTGATRRRVMQRGEKKMADDYSCPRCGVSDPAKWAREYDGSATWVCLCDCAMLRKGASMRGKQHLDLRPISPKGPGRIWQCQDCAESDTFDALMSRECVEAPRKTDEERILDALTE